MPKAEFGIIDKIESRNDYSNYEPQKYHCIQIDDEYIDDWWSKLVIMKSYFHNLDRPELGLARWGVTIIPPESLVVLQDIVISDSRIHFDQELIELVEVIQKAIQGNKYMIHYGV